MTKFILITGGCGYIGSHVAHLLQAHGFKLVVVDNLSTGFQENQLDGVHYEIGDIGDVDFMQALFKRYAIDSIIHLAAKTSVEESMRCVATYYEENLLNSLKLMELARQFNVKRFIFSSTAAVYGDNEQVKLPENASINPISVYGKSKYFAELALQDICKQYDIQCGIFRYFNVAGNEPGLSVGNYKPQAEALIQKIARNITNENYHISVYGNDFATADGSGVRDFIHVMDIGNAHYLLLDYLKTQPNTFSEVFNIGYGRGLSVLEIIQLFSTFAPQGLSYTIAERRAGDIAYSVADNTKIRQQLHWDSLYEDPYATIIESELAWCQQACGKHNIEKL